jgi:hypothetical protein
MDIVKISNSQTMPQPLTFSHQLKLTLKFLKSNHEVPDTSLLTSELESAFEGLKILSIKQLELDQPNQESQLICFLTEAELNQCLLKQIQDKKEPAYGNENFELFLEPNSCSNWLGKSPVKDTVQKACIERAKSTRNPYKIHLKNIPLHLGKRELNGFLSNFGIVKKLIVFGKKRTSNVERTEGRQFGVQEQSVATRTACVEFEETKSADDLLSKKSCFTQRVRYSVAHFLTNRANKRLKFRPLKRV